MCIQVFFIRQRKLIERDVAIFPFFDEPQEAFLSYIGRFYLHQNHLKPQEVLVPVGTYVQLVEVLLHVRAHSPYRVQKRQQVDLVRKNADIVLKEKFTLIVREEE